MVNGLKSQHMCWAGHGGGRSLTFQNDCVGVIGLGKDGSLPYFIIVYVTVIMEDNSYKFQV